jgi:hypothetical protein
VFTRIADFLGQGWVLAIMIVALIALLIVYKIVRNKADSDDD